MDGAPPAGTQPGSGLQVRRKPQGKEFPWLPKAVSRASAGTDATREEGLLACLVGVRYVCDPPAIGRLSTEVGVRGCR